MLEGRVNEVKKMFVETFNESCDFRVYTLNYNLLDGFVKEKKTFGALSALECRSYEYFNGHIKWVYRESTQKRRA